MSQFDITLNEIRTQIDAIESGNFDNVRGYVPLTKGQATKKLLNDAKDEYGYYIFVESRYPSHCIHFQPDLTVEFWGFDMMFQDFTTCVNRIIACYKHNLIPRDAEMLISLPRVSYHDEESVRDGYADIIKALAPYGIAPEQIEAYQAGEVYGIYVANMHEYQYVDTDSVSSNDDNDALTMTDGEIKTLSDLLEHNAAYLAAEEMQDKIRQHIIAEFDLPSTAPLMDSKNFLTRLVAEYAQCILRKYKCMQALENPELSLQTRRLMSLQVMDMDRYEHTLFKRVCDAVPDQNDIAFTVIETLVKGRLGLCM